MLKFTIVSIFVILITLSPVIFATPMSLARYSIKSKRKNDYIFSDGTEVPGQPISSSRVYNPNNTVVSIDITRMKGGGPTCAVVGKAGLYISLAFNSELQQYYIVWDHKNSGTLGNCWGFSKISAVEPDYNTSRTLAAYGRDRWAFKLGTLQLLPVGDTFTVEPVSD